MNAITAAEQDLDTANPGPHIMLELATADLSDEAVEAERVKADQGSVPPIKVFPR